MEVTFTLPGHPQGKGRARAFRRGDFVGHYTPEKTRSYEGMLRHAAKEAMGERLPLDMPVAIQIVAFFDIPKSYSQKKRAAAICGDLRPAKKPDLDNIIKAVTDAMNGVVFKDDAQIVKGEAGKFYGPAPLVIVTVTPA